MQLFLIIDLILSVLPYQQAYDPFLNFYFPYRLQYLFNLMSLYPILWGKRKREKVGEKTRL